MKNKKTLTKTELKETVLRLVALEAEVGPINEQISELRDKLKEHVIVHGTDVGSSGSKELSLKLGTTEVTLPLVANNRYEEKKGAIKLAKSMGIDGLVFETIEKKLATKHRVFDQLFDRRVSYSLRAAKVSDSTAVAALTAKAEILLAN